MRGSREEEQEIRTGGAQDTRQRDTTRMRREEEAKGKGEGLRGKGEGERESGEARRRVDFLFALFTLRQSGGARTLTYRYTHTHTHT